MQQKIHTRCLLVILVMLFLGFPVHADESRYKVELIAPAPLDDLLQKHLRIIEWRENPRLTPSEWQRLYVNATQNIKDLLATEGYFSPMIEASLKNSDGTYVAKFVINPGTPVTIASVNIKFSGEITKQVQRGPLDMDVMREGWLLPSGARFRNDLWEEAKRKLLANLLLNRYPTATIRTSHAEINPANNTAVLTIEIDSGPLVRFGNLSVEGLRRYPPSLVENINRIKVGDPYAQSRLLALQTQLQESGYFQTVEVKAEVPMASGANSTSLIAPIKVVVEENRSARMGIGAGYSTNTGARAQLTYDDLNILDRGWRLTSGLKLEQKAQSINGLVRLPISEEGYRDSMDARIDRTDIEGLTTLSGKAGVRRVWGPSRREQYLGANYTLERESISGGDTTTKHAATLAYGITLRHIDNNLSPTRGYLLNVQFAGAPLESLSDGRFLQSHAKVQGYYPFSHSTQFIARAEIGMVSGNGNAPADYLFRAGGDQSVRGYAYQSLGVKKDDAVVGGRYLATGSLELVQWLTDTWGAAVFADFGNAANKMQDLKPVYGYGFGARWKSPVGPIGADIAYGQDTGEYRLHFNIGVAF